MTETTKTKTAKLPVLPARDSACIQVPLHCCLFRRFHWQSKWRCGWLSDVIYELLGTGMVSWYVMKAYDTFEATFNRLQSNCSDNTYYSHYSDYTDHCGIIRIVRIIKSIIRIITKIIRIIRIMQIIHITIMIAYRFLLVCL